MPALFPTINPIITIKEFCLGLLVRSGAFFGAACDLNIRAVDPKTVHTNTNSLDHLPQSLHLTNYIVFGWLRSRGFDSLPQLEV